MILGGQAELLVVVVVTIQVIHHKLNGTTNDKNNLLLRGIALREGFTSRSKTLAKQAFAALSAVRAVTDP